MMLRYQTICITYGGREVSCQLRWQLTGQLAEPAVFHFSKDSVIQLAERWQRRPALAMGNIWRPTSIFVGPLIKGLADATQVVELLRSANAGLQRFGS
jgi:hypothetical protein